MNSPTGISPNGISPNGDPAAAGALPGGGDLLHLEIQVGDLAKLVAQRQWYGVFDACDSPWVPGLAAMLGAERAVCLYDGEAADDFWDTAPYVMKADVALLDEVRSKLWQEPWGWFFQTDADLATVKRHLKRFVFVRDPDGERLYFRFYDPRVVEPFLRFCSAAERQQFCGPIRSLATGWGKTGDAVRLTSLVGPPVAGAGGLVMRREVMDGFARLQWQVFVERTAAELRAEMPELLAPMSDDELRQFVEAGAVRARGWNIEEENHVAWLLRLSLIHEEFDREPMPKWLADILTHRRRSSFRKLSMIEDRMAFGLRPEEVGHGAPQG